MMISFDKCSKIRDRLDLAVKIKFVKTEFECVSGEAPEIEFVFPDLQIKTDKTKTYVITSNTIEKVRRSLGASGYSIIV